jgi:MFS family permease
MIDTFRQFGKQFGQNTFSSLSIRNYRLYFIGQGISQCGTWMQTVALGWLVLTLTGSGIDLGFVLALQFIPLLIGSPWGGVVVDRFNKRRILYWTQSLLGLLSLAVAALVFLGAVQLWMLYIFAFLAGSIRVFDQPARQTFISDVVGNEHIKNAVTLNSTMVNLARAIGPTIGGILIASVGIAFCFLIDAISFIAVLFMLKRMHGEALDRVPAVHKVRPRITDGFHYARSMPRISSTLIMMAIIGTFAYEFAVSLPILAQQTFLGDATAYAALTSAFGAGSAVGGLFAASRRAIEPRQLVIFAALFGLSMLGASLSPTLGIAIFGLFVVGFFSINVTSLANTMIQLESRPDMRGRVMALWNMAIFGSTPIGGPIIGYVGEHFGARWGVALGGAATVAAAVFAAHTLSRRGALSPVTPEVEMEVEEAATTPKF